jgi:hypothetical protein
MARHPNSCEYVHGTAKLPKRQLILCQMHFGNFVELHMKLDYRSGTYAASMNTKTSQWSDVQARLSPTPPLTGPAPTIATMLLPPWTSLPPRRPRTSTTGIHVWQRVSASTLGPPIISRTNTQPWLPTVPGKLPGHSRYQHDYPYISSSL